MEIELKFHLSPGDRERIEAASRSFIVADAVRHEISQYFDSKTLELKRAGVSLRVREHHGRHVQTLKSLGGVERLEAEWTVASAKPDATLLAGAQGIGGLELDRLKPVFVTDIQRHPYRIALEAGTAELVIDIGEIRAGKRREAVAELEIELKSGDASGLYGFAAALHALTPLRIAGESKAARGYRLTAGSAPEASKAQELKLAPETTMAGAMKAVVGNGLSQLSANLAGVAAGDLESLHQLRVAARRLRSALVLFDRHLEPEAARRFAGELRHFGHELSPARDWDVFLSDTLTDAMDANAERAWLTLLAGPAADARDKAYQDARTLIASPEFTGFYLALAGWVEGTLWARTADDHGLTLSALKKYAPAMLHRLAAKAHKRGDKLAKSSLEDLHSLRKTLKKLRYGGEFLSGLFDPDEVKRYNHGCKDLLERLGLINDTVTTDLLTGRLADGAHAHLAPAISLLSRRSAERRRAAIVDLPKAWAKFEKAKPFWE